MSETGDVAYLPFCYLIVRHYSGIVRLKVDDKRTVPIKLVDNAAADQLVDFVGI